MSSGEGSSRSSRRPDSMRCQARGGAPALSAIRPLPRRRPRKGEARRRGGIASVSGTPAAAIGCAGVERFLDAVDAHDRQRPAVRRPCRARRSRGRRRRSRCPDAGRGARGRGDQHAAAGGAAVLHARHHLLADIAALLETDAAIFVEQHIMREGVARRIVEAAFGDAMRDAQCMPVGFGSRFPPAAAGHSGETRSPPWESACRRGVESVCEALKSSPHETATNA